MEKKNIYTNSLLFLKFKYQLKLKISKNLLKYFKKIGSKSWIIKKIIGYNKIFLFTKILVILFKDNPS